MNTEDFERRIWSWCAEAGLLPERGRVLCAVSGGADSMCMLSALQSLGIGIACAHFDHRIRGEESSRDARFVEEFCAGNGIEFHFGTEDVTAYAQERGIGTEDAARRLRYAFLEEAARRIGAARIATAHTADDNLETMLMNLARGSGARGMSGIPPKRGVIIRPLLFATRGEVEEYLKNRGISWVVDSTNYSDDYTRNRLRHHVVPVLREINAAVSRNALEASQLMREDDEYLCALAEDFLSEHGGIDVKALLALPGPVASRALRLASGRRLGRVHVEALLALCRSEKPSAGLDLPGVRARREYGRLVFGGGETSGVPHVTLRPGEIAALPGTGLKVRCEAVENCPGINNSLNTFYFQIDTICGSISVRQRAAGDKIRLKGRGCTADVRKLFIGAKIPRDKRPGIPVIADGSGPIAVYGFGISEKHAATPGARAILVEINDVGEQVL